MQYTIKLTELEPIKSIITMIYEFNLLEGSLVRLLPLLEGCLEVWEELYSHNPPDHSHNPGNIIL